MVRQRCADPIAPVQRPPAPVRPIARHAVSPRRPSPVFARPDWRRGCRAARQIPRHRVLGEVQPRGPDEARKGRSGVDPRDHQPCLYAFAIREDDAFRAVVIDEYIGYRGAIANRNACVLGCSNQRRYERRSGDTAGAVPFSREPFEPGQNRTRRPRAHRTAENRIEGDCALQPLVLEFFVQDVVDIDGSNAQEFVHGVPPETDA